MSVPESPYTRKEMYLDAIARGDSSGIPERPYTREEMYLDAIAKNGGGGGGGGGSSTLSGLTDVDISNPTNGQTLVYNATSGKWENGESAGLQYATVTIYNISEDEGSVYELNQAYGLIINGIMNGNAEVTPINNAIAKVPLAENGCFIPFGYFYNVDDNFVPVCTGGVAIDPEFPGFLVTGDGTISAKGA